MFSEVSRSSGSVPCSLIHRTIAARSYVRPDDTTNAGSVIRHWVMGQSRGSGAPASSKSGGNTIGPGQWTVGMDVGYVCIRRRYTLLWTRRGMNERNEFNNQILFYFLFF